MYRNLLLLFLNFINYFIIVNFMVLNLYEQFFFYDNMKSQKLTET